MRAFVEHNLCYVKECIVLQCFSTGVPRNPSGI